MALYDKTFLNHRLRHASSVVFDDGDMNIAESIVAAKEVFYDLTGGTIQEMRKSRPGIPELWYLQVVVGSATITTYTEDLPHTLADWAYRFADRPL